MSGSKLSLQLGCGSVSSLSICVWSLSSWPVKSVSVNSGSTSSNGCIFSGGCSS